MHTRLNKILIAFSLMFFLQSNAISQEVAFCHTAKLMVTQFVNSRKNEDWDTIETNVYNLKRCKCEMAPVFYYIYQMRTLFPNSHALRVQSPNDFIANQKINMLEQKKIMLVCNTKLYLPLIDTMAIQRFDTEMANSAKELKKQLKHNKRS